MNNKKKAFDKSFEEKLAQGLIVDHQFAEQMYEVMALDLIDSLHVRKMVELLKTHYNKYEKFPSLSLLESIISNEVDDVLLEKKCIDFIERIKKNPLNGDLDYVKDKSLQYFRLQNIANCLSKDVLPRIESGENLEDIVSLIQGAVNKGSSRDIGYEYEKDEDKRFEEDFFEKVPSGFAYLDRLLNGGFGNKRLITFIAPSGCHAKGQKVIMFDGTFKKVEDVKVGDLLMGPDSKPRKVLNLCRGKEEMFEIKPSKGDSFIVNKNHILSLRTSSGKITNLTVEDYLSKSKNFKNTNKLYKSDLIEFNSSETLEINPYILGLILGDGYVGQGRVELTSADQEIFNEFIAYGKQNNCETYIATKRGSKAKRFIWKGPGNKKIKDILDTLGVMNKKSGDKSIPFKYKVSSKKDRLELLAGLLDTDGHNTNKCYEYVSKSKFLAEDVIFISNSLGFMTTLREKKVNEEIYYRVFISGNLQEVPCRLKRKQISQRKQIKNANHRGIININSVGVDNYYGFTLDNDHLYLMKDFTVTHNSGKSHNLVNCGKGALLSPKPDGKGRVVIHYTFELDTIDTARRYDASFTGIEINDVVGSKTKVLKDIAGKLPPGAKLIIKEYPMKSASIQTIKAHLARLKAKDVIPDIIIIDYGDLMRATEGMDGEKRHSLEAVWQDLKRLAQEMNVPVLTATQTNRSGWNSDIITPDQVSEDFSKIMTSDVIICLARNLQQKALGIGKGLLAKNRQGQDGDIFAWSIDTAKCDVKMFELTKEVEERMAMSNEEAQMMKQQEIKEKLEKFINKTRTEAN